MTDKSEMFVTASPYKTFTPRPHFRWAKSLVMDIELGAYRRELQQVWQEVRTGEIEWRPIEIET